MTKSELLDTAMYLALNGCGKGQCLRGDPPLLCARCNLVLVWTLAKAAHAK